MVSPARAGDVIKGNVVAGAQNTHGIYIGGGSTIDFGTVVQGNFVGTDVTGTVNLGNTFNGIAVETQQVTIGGTGAGEGNVIAFNKGAGVFLGYTSLGSIRRESDPWQLDLLRTTRTLGARDAGYRSRRILRRIGRGRAHGQRPRRRRHGAERLSELSDDLLGRFDAVRRRARRSQGRLNSLANTQFDLDFYSNAACLGRPQDFLEGRTYLGSSVVTTDGAGNATINAVLPVVLAPGEIVSATATDPEGNTSEFSQRIVVSSTPGSGSPGGRARHPLRLPLPRRARR